VPGREGEVVLRVWVNAAHGGDGGYARRPEPVRDTREMIGTMIVGEMIGTYEIFD